jgi:hypothetical protein
MTVRRPGWVTAQAIAASIRLPAHPAALLRPRWASAQLDEFGQAAGVALPVRERAGEVEYSHVRLDDLHARGEVFQELSQPLEKFRVVVGREIEAEAEDVAGIRGIAFDARSGVVRPGGLRHCATFLSLEWGAMTWPFGRRECI